MSLRDQPFRWYAPKNTEDGTLNAWANDPCTILYDSKKNYFTVEYYLEMVKVFYQTEWKWLHLI